MVEDFNSVFLHGEFDAKFLRADGTMLLIPASDELKALIGGIMLQWATFENHMDALIAGMHEALRTEAPEGWRTKPFNQRRAIWREVGPKYFGLLGLFGLSNELRSLSERASALQFKRNLIAHGTYSFYAPDPGKLAIKATLHRKGTAHQIDIAVDTLKKLLYDLSHLNGAFIKALLVLGVKFDRQHILVEDRQFMTGQPDGEFSFITTSDLPQPQRSVETPDCSDELAIKLP